MLESTVSSVVAKLTDLASNEAKLQYSVKNNVVQLQTELRRMQSFLKDADRRQGDELVRNWVTEVRDVAYEAEDAIEEFVFNVASSHNNGGLNSILRRCISIFTKCVHRHEVGIKIEDIQKRIKEIFDNANRYGIKGLSETDIVSTTTDSQQWRRQINPNSSDDPEIIVAEKVIDDLVKKLTEKDDERLGMVSVVGMGGTGKTVLTKKVFNHAKVKSYFDVRAWAFISQKFRKTEALVDILQEVATASDELKDIKHKDDEELVKELCKILKAKRYFVVLDDVWQSDVWDFLKRALPNEKRGSKVMLTTRDKQIPLLADSRGYIHNMEPFTKEQSRELLCSKAFPEPPHYCRQGYEKFVEESLEKCDNLPLALSVLGGILATKSTEHEWRLVCSNTNERFNERVTEILALSYNELRVELRPCFIYFGILPEDYNITARRLIQLWVAEGFVEGEEKGEKILNELVDRCMVQVVKKSLTGRIVRCRMQDRMKDFCVGKAKEEYFLKVLSQNTENNSEKNDKFRKIAIHSQEASSSATRSNPHLRTLLFFGSVTMSYTRLRSLLQEFKLLKVLQLECIKCLPKEIGKLINSRHLGIWNSRVKELPQTIGCLMNLQSLEIQKNHSVPVILYGSMILKLEKLRYIAIDEFSVHGDFRIDRLKHLHTVGKIMAGEWTMLPVENPTSLSKLKIAGLSVSQAEAVLNSLIEKSDHLQSLSLTLDDRYAKPRRDTPITRCDLQPLSRRDHLPKFHFFGPVKASTLPQNLIKLHLDWSLLEEDPMEMLRTLPNLRMVVLNENSYLGTKMVCSAGGFPILESIKLVGLYALEAWTIEKGALPHLKYLELKDCSQLKRVPEGLKFVTTLEDLVIRNMPPEFRDGVKEGGEDWDCVKHIPSIDEW